MSEKIGANMGLWVDIPDHAHWPELGRANDRLLDALVHAAVIDTLNSPPVSPDDGDRYLIGVDSAWGSKNQIAVWNDPLADWDLYTPQLGMPLYHIAKGMPLRFNGSAWTADAGVEHTSVKNFGAVGDGITDDSVAVKAALDAALPGSRVYFPAGTYLLSSWASVVGSSSGYAFSKQLWLAGDGAGVSTIKGSLTVSFSQISAALRVTDIGFSTWQNVLNFSSIPTSTVLDSVEVLNVHVTNYTGHGIYGSNSNVGTGINKLRIEGCDVSNAVANGTGGLGNTAIEFNFAIQNDWRVLNNVFNGVIYKAIALGNNSLVFADARKRYRVVGNHVENVTGRGGAENGVSSPAVIAIVVYGWQAIISQNFVQDVWKGVGTESNVDGIYTKCRYSTIQNNVLVDAGQAESYLNVKGGARNEGVTQPYGFDSIVQGNILLDTHARPARSSNGIKIATSDVLVTNNRLIGLTAIGIYTDSDTGSDAPCHNISIVKNMIKDHAGRIGIAIFGRGNRIRVNDNDIDQIINSFAVSSGPYGIQIAKKGGADIDISRNRINGMIDQGGTTPVGIGIKPSAGSADRSFNFTCVAPFPTTELITAAEHGYAVGTAVKFSTSVTLPSGLTAGTTYYVISIPSPVKVTVATTPSGSAVSISNGGTGQHTISSNPSFTFTAADGSDTFTTSNPHGFVVDQAVKVSTSDTLPGSGLLVAGTVYYIQAVPSSTTFKLAALRGSSALTMPTPNGGIGTHTVIPMIGFSVDTSTDTITTAVSHGLLPGDAFRVTKSTNVGATDFLPGGLAEGTTYYVYNARSTVSAINLGTEVITTSAAHNLLVGDPVRFTTDDTLPTGIALGTTYYVASVPSSTTLTVAATPGGSAFNFTDAGTGTHLVYLFPTSTSFKAATSSSGGTRLDLTSVGQGSPTLQLAFVAIRVADNHIDTARYGIQWSWDGTAVVVDDCFVRHNTGRNINGNAIPTLADLEKFSDTPTNLTYIPYTAAQGVLGLKRVSTTSTEMGKDPAEGATARLQEFKVLGDIISSADREWIALRAQSTAMVIESGKDGTGTYNPIEFWVSGSVAWKLSAGGTWQPAVANLDIANSTTKVRDIWLSRDVQVGRNVVANAADCQVLLDQTNTATVGAVTINKVSGMVNAAAGATTLVLTNNKVTTASHVFVQVATNDANKTHAYAAVPAAGSVTICLDPAPAAQIAISFVVFN
jgi:hypothetical protein